MKPAYLLSVARSIQYLIPSFEVDQSQRDRITLTGPASDITLAGTDSQLTIEIDPSLSSLLAAVKIRMVNLDLSLDACADISEPCSVVFVETGTTQGQHGKYRLTYKPVITRDAVPDLYNIR